MEIRRINPITALLSKLEVKRMNPLTVLLIVTFAAILAFLKLYLMRISLSYSVVEVPSYDDMLEDFANEHNICTNKTAFQVWHSIPPLYDLPLRMKYKAIKSADKPPGVMGRPVFLYRKLKEPVKQLVLKGWNEHEFNAFVSDMIPTNRTLPDMRYPWCKKQTYLRNLPQASVVIVFYNEAWSTLIRTIQSVVAHSPAHLLKQIILVDDHSSLGYLLAPLDEYVNNESKIILIRSQEREGLIRGRILAMSHVTAPVVVFLDSHCECTPGWLEPLLDRIAHDETKVVSPTVDIIHEDTFEYIRQEESYLRIGGFNWNLKFIWLPLPYSLIKKRRNNAAPIKTPTISGGLFAINKKFFEKLGYYDDGFEFWGADNLELSFKTWMCGGTLEIIPCSHVGHVFRTKFPYYVKPWSIRKNHIRLAKVWMDEYAKYYYETIGNDNIDYGDISHRVDLRKKLQCKSFHWYLRNIYPDLEIPNNHVASGSIASLSGYHLCIDSKQDLHQIDVKYCHHKGQNQFWVYTKEGQITRNLLCLEDKNNGDYMVHLNLCFGVGKSQQWIYNNHTKFIINALTEECITLIETVGSINRFRLMMQPCNDYKEQQKWSMDNFKVERLVPQLKVFADLTFNKSK